MPDRDVYSITSARDYMIRRGRATIRICGHPTAVNPDYHPGLGIAHTGKVTWQIVHIPSQMAVGKNFVSYADAESAALAMASVISWLRDLDEISRIAEGRPAVQAMLQKALGTTDLAGTIRQLPEHRKRRARRRDK